MALRQSVRTVPRHSFASLASHATHSLGGGSSINSMMYASNAGLLGPHSQRRSWVRGDRNDFDVWANKYGCAGWSYEEVLPYFKRIETFEKVEAPSVRQGAP